MKVLRIITLLTASLVCACLIAGCESRKQKMDYTEDELPYGSTMRENKTGFSVPITYDRRFLNEEQMAAVANYYSAVQNQDAGLYLASTIDFYVDYQVSEVYKDSCSSIEEMVAALHTSIANNTGEDFTFEMVTVSACTQEGSASGMNNVLELLEELSGDENFRSTVEDCWALDVDWLIRSSEKSALAEGNKLYLLQIGGQYYCVM